jgi:hypothetical protein
MAHSRLGNYVANSTLGTETNVSNIRMATGLARNREGPLPAYSVEKVVGGPKGIYYLETGSRNSFLAKSDFVDAES